MGTALWRTNRATTPTLRVLPRLQGASIVLQFDTFIK